MLTTWWWLRLMKRNISRSGTLQSCLELPICMWTYTWLIGRLSSRKIPHLRLWSNGFPTGKYRIWNICWEMMQTQKGKGYPLRMEKTDTLPGSPLPSPHTGWGFGRSFVVHIPHGSPSGCMNGNNQDAWHQGQQWTLHLLQDWFWWPGMAMKMQKVISNCKQCIHHESTQAKAPMQPIIATAPLELLHMGFTSIEMTMDLDQPPNVVSILVFFNHFAKHVMAYVTPPPNCEDCC